MPWTQLGPAGEPALPAGRDDTAMIERAAEAIARARALKWEHCDLEMRDEYRADARAAAAVIVPATAEQIAAAIADASEEEPLSARFVAGMDYARLIARRFAVGLSAGAAGGDGDE